MGVWVKAVDGGVDGEPISLVLRFNELDEARFVVNRIKTGGTAAARLRNAPSLCGNAGTCWKSVNTGSMPYRGIYGGMRFFDAGEIKDALSYAFDCQSQR